MRASKFILGAAASALLAATSLLAPRAAAAAERLPALGVDLGQTTVSGLSSGAYMAVQFHVAFSGIVRGVGVVAGGPYYCAEGQLLTNALNRCMGTRLGEPDPDRLLRLARAAADELALTGERVRPLGARGRAALTPAERRVADLALAGHSNREIAAALVVSRKTVEFHLARCYRKLEVAGRDGLAAALATSAAAER